MSGSHLVEQPPEAAAKPPATDSPTEDHAASLRAAALLTLKSKRRRLTISSSDSSHPPRPTLAPPSIQLDYGSEEPSGGVSSIASSPAMQPVASAAPVPEQMDVDDSQGREEGEISDSESTSTPPAPVVDTKAGPTPQIVQPDQATVRMPPPPVPKIEPISPLLSSAPTSTPSAVASVTGETQTHIRPGLTMTEAQYLTARDIILDLLGWGVSPEYLVNCGLSREIIFYVFAEHNLRLPSNIDLTGLLPYVPPAPTPSSATNDRSTPSCPTPERSSSLSAAALAFVPSGNVASGSSTPSTTLHDIEQQRKQELLARKAAQATRKLKQQKSTTSVDPQMASMMAVPIATSKGDSSSSISVPTKTVDDFLKSIEPAGPSALPSSKTSAIKPPRFSSADDMDVDEIPGLTGGFSATTDYTPIPRPIPPRSATASLSSATSLKSPVAPSSAISTTSGSSFIVLSGAINGKAALPYDDDADAVPGLFQAVTPPEDLQPSVGRRGTKRPVASDFVDMEPGPSRTDSRGPPPDQIRGRPRRKTTGFAGLPQRRCVIELSDDEDDIAHAVTLSNGNLLRNNSFGSTANTPQTSIAPTPRMHSPALSSTVNPSALLEKEEEIRRMRERIAQRERSRLRKLASKSRGTPSSVDGQSNSTVAIKQEEDDSAAAQSLRPTRSSSSATSDPSSSLRPSEGTEERTVAAFLLPHEGKETPALSSPDSESTSGAVTPMDVVYNTLEHTVTGDQVLTDEAQQEQVVASPESIREDSHDIEVDVVGMHPETSAQVEFDITNAIDDKQTAQTPVFETYLSLLDRHPLLRASSRRNFSIVDLSASLTSASSVASSSTSFTDIDLKPLKQAAVLKYLSDNSRQICQYELGGGECRDKSCENVHLSRLSAVEPSDEDTAQYLCSSIPAGQRHGVEVFRKALDVARLSHPNISLDARVQVALTRLGLR